MSLANVLAVSQAAKSVVLLGDPQQLEQPQKGSHPDGVDASALEHILGGTRRSRPTAASSCRRRGGWRRPSARSRPSCSTRAADVASGAGAAGASSASPASRAAACGRRASSTTATATRRTRRSRPSRDLVDRLLAPGAGGRTRRATTTQLTADDILVVAPYNAQVSRLAERAGAHGRARRHRGQVPGPGGAGRHLLDGDVAPEDAPRGMEFLYSLNRLNVATSRAQVPGDLVASPRLFEPECRTPRQMQLANALCRFRELARAVAARGPWARLAERPASVCPAPSRHLVRHGASPRP